MRTNGYAHLQWSKCERTCTTDSAMFRKTHLKKSDRTCATDSTIVLTSKKPRSRSPHSCSARLMMSQQGLSSACV
jgi:hypothetical protein